MRSIVIFFFSVLFLAACSDNPNPVVPECERSSDCDAGEICTNQVCVPDGNTEPECRTSADCDGDQICVAEACVPDDGTLAECTPLGELENGSVTQPEAPHEGDSATFSCDTGFELVGEESLLCGADGEWSGDAPICGSCDEYGATAFEMKELASDDPDETDYVFLGFDLDGLNTEEATTDPPTPENGCAMKDQPGGVDNSLGQVLALLALFGLDVEAGISALMGDALIVETQVRAVNDDITMTIIVNDEVAVEGLEVTTSAEGLLEASVDTFVFEVNQLFLRDVEDDLGVTTPVYADIRLTLNKAHFRVDPETGSILIGGVLVYGDDESGDDTFRPNVVGIVKALEDAGASLPVTIAQIDGIFMGAADFALDGETCQDLSFGMRLPGAAGLCE